MFRRLWSGLPEDVTFPSDLKGLGYFVNEDDEIRSIEEPGNYFKFFINRNPRICARQRFAFNRELFQYHITNDGYLQKHVANKKMFLDAMEAIVHERLEKEGMQKLRLPQGTPATEPHIPIFITPNLDTKTRIVVIFGEPTQDLGIVAGRVANGPGGINEGSMVSIVRALASQRSSPDDASPPGIVLANTGQTYWWPEGKRAITVSASAALPLPSLMHKGIREVPSLNGIPGNENPREHVKCVFDQVLGCMAGEQAVVDVVAIGETCEIVEKFLDGKEAWGVWGKRLGSLVLLGPVFEADGLTNGEFKDFQAKRARGYLLCSEPAGIPLAPPEGNPELSILPMGFPCVSSSEPSHVETILIQARAHILSHIQDVAMNPGYENPVITLAECLRPALTEQDWVEVPEEEKPVISKADPTELKKELKQAKRWKKFAETGVAPDTDSESESDV